MGFPELKLKVCGLTNAADRDRASGLGADYFGFIVYPKSPRFVTAEEAAELAEPLPRERRVAVVVNPALDELDRLKACGFQRFQIHCEPGDRAAMEAWSERIGPTGLCLAPRLKPGERIDPGLLPLAESFLVDAFSDTRIGGTGKTCDWGTFARMKSEHPGKAWFLAGGLGPGNIAEAIEATGAEYLDVNSGVESAPGRKDPAKLEALFRALGGRNSWARVASDGLASDRADEPA